MEDGLRLEPRGAKLTADADKLRTEAAPLAGAGGCRPPPPPSFLSRLGLDEAIELRVEADCWEAKLFWVGVAEALNMVDGPAIVLRTGQQPQLDHSREPYEVRWSRGRCCVISYICKVVRPRLVVQFDVFSLKSALLALQRLAAQSFSSSLPSLGGDGMWDSHRRGALAVLLRDKNG